MPRSAYVGIAFRGFLAALAVTLVTAGRAHAEDARIVVVLVEPSREQYGFRATVGSVVSEDPLALMTALQAHCDGENDERGDRVVLLASQDVTLALLTDVSNIVSKPCHDARRVAYFTFNRAGRMWRFPAPRAGDPLNLAFTTGPGAFRTLLAD